MDIEKMHFTGPIWRPPYEAGSVLLQATVGCTHHRCKFCSLYPGIEFRVSPMSRSCRTWRYPALPAAGEARVSNRCQPFRIEFRQAERTRHDRPRLSSPLPNRHILPNLRHKEQDRGATERTPQLRVQRPFHRNGDGRRHDVG